MFMWICVCQVLMSKCISLAGLTNNLPPVFDDGTGDFTNTTNELIPASDGLIEDLTNMTNELTHAFDAVKELSQSEILEDYNFHNLPFKRKDLVCKACKYGVLLIIKMYTYKVPLSVIKQVVTKICAFIIPQRVCKGLVDLNADIFVEILKRNNSLTHKNFCGTIFENLRCYGKKPIVNWKIDYDFGTKMADNENSVNDEELSSNESVYYVAHITDLHYEEMYEPGALAECKEPMCCRSDQGKPNDISKAAGKWGDYRNCDIPWKVINNTLHTIKEKHKEIKYVYMTGDLIGHNVWDTTKTTNTDSITKQGKFFHEIFGDSIQIFPVVGNHEAHPANVVSPPYIKGQFSSQWLYESFYESWCKHLPIETKETILQGGYYTYSPEPGKRIIGLNTIFGYVYNWWLILDPIDPAGQLSWLAKTLHEAEKRNEKVHILTHSPTGMKDILKVWSRQYHRIINRFDKIIKCQFYGHTHKDQFYVFYKSNTTEPNNVAFNAGSVTTYPNVNPNYRIYKIKKDSWEVEDFDTYIYNITEANLDSAANPRWFKLYSFREEYNLSSLNPKELGLLVERLAKEEKLFNNYFRFYVKNSDAAILKGCNEDCKKERLCEIVTTNSYNNKHCKRISKL